MRPSNGLPIEKEIAPGRSDLSQDYNALCAATVEAQCGCNKECIEAQLNEHFEKIKTSSIDTEQQCRSADRVKNASAKGGA